MSSYTPVKQRLQEQFPQLKCVENQVLAPYTTFKIGGNCPLMAFPTTEQEIIACFQEAADLPCYALGNGSNLLISDQGVSGFFIQSKEFSQITGEENQKITAQSGILLSKLAHFAMEHQLSGLEFAHGIPGTLGGALVMNAGAYGREMKDVVVSVRSYSYEEDKIRERSLEELEFSYRHSLFSSKKEFILSATLDLDLGDKRKIQHQMKELAQKRREKQPLEFPSCGSTFKRPPNHFAAALIDQCGLKGFTVGGAQVSPKHAGFVVNLGNATCADVLALVAEVQEKVLSETGIPLELEVKTL